MHRSAPQNIFESEGTNENPHDSVANGQIIIALVVAPEGLPLAYEVLPGNTSDKTTLRAFLDASSGNTARRAGSG